MPAARLSLGLASGSMKAHFYSTQKISQLGLVPIIVRWRGSLATVV